MKSQLCAVYRRLFANRFFFPLNSFLLEASLKGLGTIDFGDFKNSGELHFTTKTLKRWFEGKEPPVLFDVGANRGSYSQLLRSAFPESQVFAFEPHPRTFENLCEALDSDADAKMIPVNAALGSAPGELKLFDYASAGGSTHATVCEDVLRMTSDRPLDSTVVSVETLDDFAKSRSIERIDFLKIDTEGFDLSVIEGGKELIARKAISVLQIEFGAMHLHSRVYVHDFVARLPGFHFFRLLPKSLIPIQINRPHKSEIFAYQNIIAVAPEFVDRCGFAGKDLRRSAA